MAGRTFVPFEIVRFPTNRHALRTEERAPRGALDDQTDPVYTELRFRTRARVREFNLATVTHRKGVHVDGYWHGNPIHEIVQVSNFDAYFSLNQHMLIANAKKDVALSAVHNLTTEFHQILELREYEIDFSRIIPRALNLIGSWFKGMRHTNITTEAAFGSHINQDEEFRRKARLGTLSNLIVVMDFGGDTIKANLSKIGSAYFLEGYPIETCIGFLLHLRRYRIPAS